MKLEDVLTRMKPYITTAHYNNYFLNLMASVDRDYWSASYQDIHGRAYNPFIADGKTPLKALLALEEKMKLLELLEKPAIKEGS